LLVIVSSRKGHVSFGQSLEKLPYYLSAYFKDNSFIMLYPQQVEKGLRMDDVQYIDSSLAENVAEKVSYLGSKVPFWKKLFKKNNY
jgi:hypothetical protein